MESTASAPAAAAAARPTKSVSRATAEGNTARFPSKDDLVAAFVEGGQIASEEQMLAEQPELTAALVRRWVASGQTGCVYAGSMSRDASYADRWKTAALSREVPQRVFDAWIAAVTNTLGEASILLLTFPYVRDEPALARMIGQLSSSPDWWWERRGLGRGRLVGVGLRWLLPDGEHVSWPLGFGPFDWMPFTRRAPYASVVMQVRPEAHNVAEELPGPDGLRGVHLAHLQHHVAQGEPNGPVWTKTEELKRTLLWADLAPEGKSLAQAVAAPGGTPAEGDAASALMRDAWTVLAPEAKAKVTFTLQAAYLESLPPAERRDRTSVSGAPSERQ